jgi:hypothetical protein
VSSPFRPPDARAIRRSRRRFWTVLVLVVLLAAIAMCYASRRRGEPPVGETSVAPETPAGPAADRSSYAQFLPDSARTPGATLPVTPADICVPGYSRKVRNVPAAVKRQAYESYGIPTHRPHQYEVDHLISLELGGSNSIRNLWPESYETEPWNAQVKDRLENELHRRVCAGEMPLAVAQRAIATDWIAAYRQYVGPSPAPVGQGH